MNSYNFKTLIERYEENYDFVNNEYNEEIFKCKAVQHFRDVWFSDFRKNYDFAASFNAARKESSVMIDNSRISPTSGIVKMAEKEPEEVERLFNEVLLAEDNGDIKIRHKNMEAFLGGIEAIRQKHFSQFWKYKQDRHAASCYLTFFAPEKNFIYRYSEAEDFANYIEFGKDIGSGADFKLEVYYELCELIVEELKKYPSLIAKYRELTASDEYYKDENLHIMAFDLMYCCRCYNFYKDLSHASKKDSIKEYKTEQAKEQEEKEKQEQRETIESKIYELEKELEQFEDISLLDVTVSHKSYGEGVVVEQQINKIKVRFKDIEKSFIINKKFIMRPTFENDTEIVEAFTEYDSIKDEIGRLKRELARI